MTDTPQTPTECTEPARTEPAGEAGAATETARDQAIAALIEATDQWLYDTDPAGRTERFAAALAPFIVIERGTARDTIAHTLRERPVLDERDVPVVTDAILRALTGSSSRPDAGEAVTIDRETAYNLNVELISTAIAGRCGTPGYEAWRELVVALATSGRRREGDGK